MNDLVSFQILFIQAYAGSDFRSKEMPLKYKHKDHILQGGLEELSSDYLKSIDEAYIQQRVNTLTRNMLLITTSPPHLDSWLTLLGSYLEELQKGLSNLSAQDAFEKARKRVALQLDPTGLPTKMMKLVVQREFCTKRIEPKK